MRIHEALGDFSDARGVLDADWSAMIFREMDDEERLPGVEDVRTLDALRRTVVDPAVYEDVAAGGWLCLFVFTEEAYGDDADLAARMLTFHQTLHEDPATGSANTAFAAHLRSLGRSGPIVVEQGFEIDRQSRLYLEVGERIRVGGKVRPVLRGTLEY